MATTITPSCVPTPSRQLSNVLKAHPPFLCPLSLGWECAVEVFEDHRRGGIGASFFKQVENIGALFFHVAQVQRVGLDVRMRGHHAEGRGLAVARCPPQQVSRFLVSGCGTNCSRRSSRGPLPLATGTLRHTVHTGDNRMQWLFGC